VSICSLSFADEGLWVPFLLKETCYETMRDQGLLLSVDEIYGDHQTSLKDAVVMFGDGCTGVIVSNEGLLFTNYHCTYNYVGQQSTVEHNYLENGFWANSREEELLIPTLSVKILTKMDDVTDQIVMGINAKMTMKERAALIQINTEKVIKNNNIEQEKNHLNTVKQLDGGNRYFLYCYEVYHDIRLVGLPPSAIGKFGGESDNWMWPRYSGDFAMFRIYSDRQNQPSEYSSNNVPYQPRKSVPISISNLSEDSFSFVMGYPSRTHRFITSYELSLIANEIYPQRALIYEQCLNIWKKYMNTDNRMQLQYASKYASYSNFYKKWKGIISGVKQVDGITKKQQEEQTFMQKVASSQEWKVCYGQLIDDFRVQYEKISNYTTLYEILYGGLRTIELFRQAEKINRYIETNIEQISEEAIENFLKQQASFYENINLKMDKEIFVKMTTLFYQYITPEFYPEFYDRPDRNPENLANELYDSSALISYEKLQHWFIGNKQEKLKELANDPAIRWVKNIRHWDTEKLSPFLPSLSETIDSLYSVYTHAVLQVFPDRKMYPDANQTLRLSYGKTKGYISDETSHYNFSTDIDGLMEKVESGQTEYFIPNALRELYKKKDYGIYKTDSTLLICFITNAHTTSGNSGSPVFNGRGELIGLNFDRNQEGTMSDILYDPLICRNIAVDIRYILFIIDKYAKASYLLNEMTIQTD
jgi:hypothetical protein